MYSIYAEDQYSAFSFISVRNSKRVEFLHVSIDNNDAENKNTIHV